MGLDYLQGPEMDCFPGGRFRPISAEIGLKSMSFQGIGLSPPPKNCTGLMRKPSKPQGFKPISAEIGLSHPLEKLHLT